MKISGFTMVRNADTLYFPIEASVKSLLPLVDELIVALGRGNPGDKTRSIIEGINSPKIKIFDRVWHNQSFVESKIFAEETNFALQQCHGDWCIYLQADEVIHEKDYPTILSSIQKASQIEEVDGLLFKYFHFWGDYHHHLPYHGWYKHEIRAIKNHRNIYSYKDAQSFRKKNDLKLNVAEIDARIYHYGWVRPPAVMQQKKKEHESFHHGRSKAEKMYASRHSDFDYGPMGKTEIFSGSHPSVMEDWISQFFWEGALNYNTSGRPNRPLHKHERRGYRLLSWIENNIMGRRSIFGYSNWHKKLKL